ncbi:MAG: hypothetical protein JW941_08185 [Candidatus Coatesbacteria bacterium]|nr:hypothetical protein [Candidatus Coatesbacteria bacterium]
MNRSLSCEDWAVRLLQVVWVSCLLLLLSSHSAMAEKYQVNLDGTGDFTVIQDAINAADDGDTVIVHPGTYHENICFNGKNIILSSIDPGDVEIVNSTVIDGCDLRL